MIVALNLSLVGNFIRGEARRLAALGHVTGSCLTNDEAKILWTVSARDISGQMPVAIRLASVIQRVGEDQDEHVAE